MDERVRLLVFNL
jgi:COP9 signalosome complex subunit 5